MGLSERYRVWRLSRGDREACRELVSLHHRAVYGYLRHLGADRALAEDLTQETYAKAWRRIDTLQRSSSLRSWLLTIARNEFFQWARVERPEIGTTGEVSERRDDHPGQEAALLESERDRILRRAVGRLEPELRETVALHYFHGLSLRECGTLLEVPSGTVKSRVHRALGCLRELLETMEADHESERTGTALARDP